MRNGKKWPPINAALGRFNQRFFTCFRPSLDFGLAATGIGSVRECLGINELDGQAATSIPRTLPSVVDGFPRQQIDAGASIEGAVGASG